MTVEPLLYQPLRFIITLIQCTSKRNMISYVDDGTKGSMANRYVYILSLSSCVLSRHYMYVYHW